MFIQIMDRIQGKAPKGKKRSSKWPSVRRIHLNLYPTCVACGSKKKIEVHHIVPFHTAPFLELSSYNLLTLCERKKYGINCHLSLGHIGNYREINPDVKEDALGWMCKLNSWRNRSRGDTHENE